jgi:hypothetical protein
MPAPPMAPITSRSPRGGFHRRGGAVGVVAREPVRAPPTSDSRSHARGHPPALAFGQARLQLVSQEGARRVEGVGVGRGLSGGAAGRSLIVMRARGTRVSGISSASATAGTAPPSVHGDEDRAVVVG